MKITRARQFIDPAPGRVHTHVFFKEVYLGPPIFQKLNWCFPAKRMLCFSELYITENFSTLNEDNIFLMLSIKCMSIKEKFRKNVIVNMFSFMRTTTSCSC